jgi:hypothetical protein
VTARIVAECYQNFKNGAVSNQLKDAERNGDVCEEGGTEIMAINVTI